MKNKKGFTHSLYKSEGFTLIELLVVIAIIGLLSTMAVVSLNSARGKARDAQRLSDVKQLSMVIEMAATSRGDYDIFTTDTCEEAGDLTTACGTIEDNDFSIFYDPVSTQRAVSCDGGAADTACGYTMMLDSNPDSYQMCFYLEYPSGSIPARLNKVTEGSRVSSGCIDL